METLSAACRHTGRPRRPSRVTALADRTNTFEGGSSAGRGATRGGEPQESRGKRGAKQSTRQLREIGAARAATHSRMTARVLRNRCARHHPSECAHHGQSLEGPSPSLRRFSSGRSPQPPHTHHFKGARRITIGRTIQPSAHAAALRASRYPLVPLGKRLKHCLLRLTSYTR